MPASSRSMFGFCTKLLQLTSVLGHVYCATPRPRPHEMAVMRNMSMLYWHPEQDAGTRLGQSITIDRDDAEVHKKLTVSSADSPLGAPYYPALKTSL